MLALSMLLMSWKESPMGEKRRSSSDGHPAVRALHATEEAIRRETKPFVEQVNRSTKQALSRLREAMSDPPAANTTEPAAAGHGGD